MGPQQQQQGPKGVKVYRKADETEDYFSGPMKKNVGGQKNSSNVANQSQFHASSYDIKEVDKLKIFMNIRYLELTNRKNAFSS